MRLNTLHDLYVDQLRELYDAELQLVYALPKMADSANDAELARAFCDHLDKTRRHVRRLAQVFDHLEGKPDGKSCKAMEGLIKGSEDLTGQASRLFRPDADPAVLDAGLIAHARRIEHYEIAGYGTVCKYAETLGRNDDHDLLSLTLDEEKASDGTLAILAEQFINVHALVAVEARQFAFPDHSNSPVYP